MADVSLHDGPAPSAPSPRDADAPPASADSAGHSATPAISDELKARMDKVVYSDVNDHLSGSTVEMLNY